MLSLSVTVLMSDRVIKNFSILTFTAIGIKILGGLYRLPFANLLGSTGVGLYQMIFPVYTLCLTLTSSSVPTSISRIISSELTKKNEKIVNLIYTSRLVVFGFSLVVMVALMLGSFAIGRFQGVEKVGILYLAIAPAIVFVRQTSVNKGINQGKFNMKVTAITELFQQGIKIVLGVLFLYLFKSNMLLAVTMAVVSLTISEILSYFYSKFATDKLIKITKPKFQKQLAVKFMKMSLPMVLSFSLLPVVAVVESKIVINSYVGVGGYGIVTGCAMTIVGLLITVISQMGVLVVPLVARGKSCGNKDVVAISIKATTVVATVFGVAIFMLPREITEILFGGLSVGDREILISVLRFSSVLCLVYSLATITTSCLYGMNRPTVALVGNAVGGAIKIAVLLAAIDKFGVNAIVFSTIAHYFVAVMWNLIYIKRVRQSKIPWLVAVKTVAIGVMEGGVLFLTSFITNSFFRLAVSGTLSLLVVFVGLFVFGIVTKVQVINYFYGRSKGEKNEN